MSVTIAPVDRATDTFDGFIAKANLVIAALSANVVTTNASANGAVTSGNAQLTGHLHVNALSAHTLQGGNNQVANTLVVSSNVSVGNSTSNVVLTFSTVTVGGVVLNATSLAAGANVYVDTVRAVFGNSTVNAVVNSVGLVAGQAVVNSGGVYVGANVVLSDSLVSVGNSTVNAVMNSSVLVIDRVDAATINIAGITQNSTFVGVGANVYMNVNSFFVGNSTVNAVLNSTALAIGTAVVNSSVWTLGTLVGNTTVFRNGANVLIETARYVVGNSTVNAVLNSVGLVVGSMVVNSSALTFGTSVVNSSAVAAGANVRMETARVFAGNATVNTVMSGPSVVTPLVNAVTMNVTSVAYFANIRTSIAATERSTDTQFYSGNSQGWILPTTAVGLRKALGLNTDWYLGYFPESLNLYGTSHRVVSRMPYAGTITSLTRKLSAGAITVSVQINGVTVGGLSGVTANTTRLTSAATSAFAFAEDAYITLIFGGTITSSDQDLSWEIEVERT